MKPVNNYILLVDNHRRPSLQRNTAGRYRVAAKTPDEAVALLREKIGFGSIQVYYKCDSGDKFNVPYKTVVKEVFNVTELVHAEPRHATAPQSLKRKIVDAEKRSAESRTKNHPQIEHVLD